MKRNIVALGIVSLCFLGLAASESQAFFGWLHPRNPYSLWHHHNRYVTHITCRPYNAFTPIAWGNLVCDGCVPNPCGVAGGCLPMTMGTPPFPPNGCGPMGCGMPSMGGGYGPGGCCASDMGPMMSQPMPYGPMPYGPMPMAPGGPSFTPPMPMPVGPNTTMMYPPMHGVAQANYQPQYYPMPYPNYYTPTPYNPYAGYQQQGYQQQGYQQQGYQQPMPYYWYGAGR